MEKLVEKLFAADPRQVRISCRAQDWLGESDLASLNPFFELGGEPVVLDLQKLSREEQRAVLAAQGMGRARKPKPFSVRPRSVALPIF